MRVFDSYRFNIANIVTFQKTHPYLEQMFSETGFGYKNLGFSFSDISTGLSINKALERYPSLQKYFYTDREDRSPILSSYSNKWRDGDVYADKEDWENIFEIYSKIPRTFDIPFGNVVYDGINWFEDSSDFIAIDYKLRCGYPPSQYTPFHSNHIAHIRGFNDGRKYNLVIVCIETTNNIPNAQPRDSKPIVEKLKPYLGEPDGYLRECVFSRDEQEHKNALERPYNKLLTQMSLDILPDPEPLWEAYRSIYFIDEHTTAYVPELPHVADKAILNKVFKGTTFKRGKGTGNWLHKYVCTDKHGFLYEAYIQKITGCNQFRVWFSISGYNFEVGCSEINYYVTKEGESGEILSEYVHFCMELYMRMGDRLSKDFGDTPDWYWE